MAGRDKGAIKQMVGKVKEAAGKVLGNPTMRAEGKREKTAGKVEEHAAAVKRPPQAGPTPGATSTPKGQNPQGAGPAPKKH